MWKSARFPWCCPDSKATHKLFGIADFKVRIGHIRSSFSTPPNPNVFSRMEFKIEKADVLGISGVVWEVPQYLCQVVRSVWLEWVTGVMKGKITPLLFQNSSLRGSWGKALQAVVSWWNSLNFGSFLAKPGAVFFTARMSSQGSLPDAKQHMDTWLGLQSHLCTEALFLLDVNTWLLSIYYSSEYYSSCKFSLHPLQLFRFDRIPEAY